MSAQQILNMEKESDEDISDDPGDEDPCVPSISDAHIYLEKMKTFAQHQGHASLLEHVMISCDIINSISVTKSKQTTITDFFFNQIECKIKRFSDNWQNLMKN